jgi:hypothetical protein
MPHAGDGALIAGRLVVLVHASPPGGARTSTGFPGVRLSAASSALVLATFLLGGCGQSTVGYPCLPRARAVVARVFGVAAARVSMAVSTGGNAMRQCTFTAAPRGARGVRVTVNVDTGAQAYFRLERTVVEASQVFSTVRLIAAPQQVPGIGLDADWFPAEQQLMTTDGRRLLTVSVGWGGASESRRRALAEVVVGPYLGRR